MQLYKIEKQKTTIYKEKIIMYNVRKRRKQMNKIINTILISTMLLSAQTEYQANFDKKLSILKSKATYIEPLVLKAKLEHNTNEQIYILDVRESNEVEPQGHIKSSNYINIPRGLVEFKINKNIPGLNSKIIVVCYSELRSLFVQKNLKELGYKNVKVLKGGMQRWNEECLPKNESSNLFFLNQKKGSCGGQQNNVNLFQINRSGE